MFVPYRRERMSREAMVAAAREFPETVRLRRTVRDFTKKTVSDVMVER